ncbi:MAG: NifB/NifX family molybdenum-iron cluster-binding protein, partial [Victivallaceae bacterium]
MKIALTVWNGRVAPVFDVSGQLLILEMVKGQIINETAVDFPRKSFEEKVSFLKTIGIGQLICGTISCQAQALSENSGIKVYAFIAGDYREVVNAWLDNKLERGGFAMPGCGKRRKCCCRGVS